MKNQIVLITGASSGIGEACAKLFAKESYNLILVARRLDLLNKVANEIKEEYNVKILTAKLDVQKYKEVEKFIKSLDQFWCKIDILINNAGLAIGFNPLYDDNPENWDTVLDTNIKGVLNFSHSVVKLMIKNGSGHIINIGSIAGHEAYPKGSVYCASKHAVSAITKAMRAELIDKNIRVSTVDPGMVETNFSNVRFDNDLQRAKNVYKGFTPLNANDIAEAVYFCASRPPHCNINEMIIMPSVQATSMIVHKNE